MKKYAVVITIILLGIVVLFVTRHRTTTKQTTLPPEEATTIKTEEPISQIAYDANAPLSKNKVIIRNGMKIEITQEGTGPEIVSGKTAVMSYVGKFENGTIFDASKNHGDGTFSFVLGAKQVIKGWDEGVKGMRVGESRILTIPGDLAYGPNGIPGVIPPNATLIFDITLIAIK